MQELARVRLENEMDLILAHKRAMRLAELTGLSLSAQTTFATAVSEVARTTCDSGRCGTLVLSVDTDRRDRYIVATLTSDRQDARTHEGLEYAKRLVSRYNVSLVNGSSSIELFFYVNPPFRIDILKLDEWRHFFRNEPPVSPYEELKRRNEQLQELSDRVQKSEAQYKILTNTLPLIIFSLNGLGELVYANDWLYSYTGATSEQLNRNRWESIVHPDDYDAFSLLLQSNLAPGATTVRLQARLKHHVSGEYFWHQVTLTPFRNEKSELQYWIGYIADIHAEKIVEETLKDNFELQAAQAQLREQQLTLEQTISELNRSNLELQQFAYVASHDLQEPVRKVLYYSDYLVDRYGNHLDTKGIEYLKSMQTAAHRMRALIHDVLSFSQINSTREDFGQVQLDSVASDALQDLEIAIEESKAVVNVAPLPEIQGDEPMLRQLFSNIIGNAIKYAKPGVPPVVNISAITGAPGEVVLAFADNGIGFDEKYLPRLFGLFQRLHQDKDYEGTGIGLAICKKIVDAHGGRIWADSREGVGSTFLVAFPAEA
jgi:PAS domain S-box-containing protein